MTAEVRVAQQIKFALGEMMEDRYKTAAAHMEKAAKIARKNGVSDDLSVIIEQISYDLSHMGTSGDGSAECPRTFRPFDYRKALKWDEVIGLESAKEILRRSVVMPLVHSKLAKSARSDPPNVLMYGPGGTGKTTIAQAIAKQVQKPFYQATAGDIKGKFYGEAQKCLEKFLKTGRDNDALVFIDEIDSIVAGEQELDLKLQSSFKELVQPGTNMPPPVLIGATNVPWSITDEAIVRRFGLYLCIPLPDPSERREFLNMRASRTASEGCAQRSLNLTSSEWNQVIQMTKRFSPDDLRRLFDEAKKLNPISINNADMIYVDEKLNATLENTGRRAIDLSEDDMLKVCWPSPSFNDIKAVINAGIVRASNTVQSLVKFKEFALLWNDTNGAEEIQRSIDE